MHFSTMPTGYLEITPAVAYKVLSEILANSGISIDEPDPREIEKVLTSTHPVIPIPLDNNVINVVEETYREITRNTPPPPPSPLPIISHGHDEVPRSLEFGIGCGMMASATTTTMITISSDHFNKVELASDSAFDEENMNLSLLKTTLKLFSLNARSILELFHYCEGSNDGFCRCPEIRMRVYELGILVQRVEELANNGSLFDNGTTTFMVSMSWVHFNEVQLALLAQCSTIDENMELSFLKNSLKLQAKFLQMQLKLFNLKARSVLELFQYCEGYNTGYCRCPEIRKRVYEMGILVQRQ